MKEIVLDKETVQVVVSSFFRVMDRMDEDNGNQGVHLEEDEMIQEVCRELGVWKS